MRRFCLFIANGSLSSEQNMQNVAFNFMHRDVVLDLSDALNGVYLVGVNVDFCLRGESRGGVAR